MGVGYLANIFRVYGVNKLQYKLLKLTYNGEGSYVLRIEEQPNPFERFFQDKQKHSFEIVGDGKGYWRNAHCNLREKLSDSLIKFANECCKKKKGMG